jgi:hypothetical protein
MTLPTFTFSSERRGEATVLKSSSQDLATSTCAAPLDRAALTDAELT